MDETGREPEYTRIAADADVLAADLLCDGAPRDALDQLRRHSWLSLVVTEPLLDDAEAVIASLADAKLAADWRETVEPWSLVVEQPSGDHPGLAAAYRGRAAHLLSMDERLLSAKAGADLSRRMTVSVRSPDAFATVFDPESLYESLFEEPYAGPDRDPRA